MSFSFDIIVAVDRVGGIGKDGQMPWPRLTTDLRHFRSLTTGGTLIMGRKTWESIGYPLPRRTTIVIGNVFQPETHPDHFDVEGAPACTAASLSAALQLAEHIGYKTFVVGGAQVYRDAIDEDALADVYLTTIEATYPCDRFVSWAQPTNRDEYLERDDSYDRVLVEQSTPTHTLDYRIERFRRRRGD